MTNTWSRAPRAAAVIAVTGLAIGLSGCGGEEQPAYCTDAEGVVVDPDLCEDSGGHGYFIYYGSGLSHNAQPGDRLSGGTKIAYNDSGARSKVGLPATGKISSGGGFGGTAKVGGGGFGGGFGGSGSSGG